MSKIKNIIGLIPARMESSRFPGKPMKKIRGIPMIGRVYLAAKKSLKMKTLYVATCNKIIFDYIKSIGGKVIMTSKKHTRATDRCAEALIKIEKKERKYFSHIVMIQGDEPLVNSKMIDESLKPFNNIKINVVNLLGKFENKKEFLNQNIIKVVCDINYNARYFTRKLDLKYFNSSKVKLGKQICIIPFKREYLFKYLKFKQTPLEIVESVDMWRFLENNINVYMARTKEISVPVDHKNDIRIVEKYLSKL